MTRDAIDAPIAAFAPLGVPEYRRIWTASTVSHVGTFLQLTAAPWIMHELTGSPFLVGLVTTALLSPRLLLALPSGALADVMDRRTLIIVGQVVSAVPVAVMAVLAYAGQLTPALLLVLTFLIGIGNAISLPSFQTLVPDLVPREMLAQAITLNSAAFNVARAFGPSLGGALVALGLTHVAFGANAVSYLAVIGVLLTLPRREFTAGVQRRLWRSTRTGIRYVRFTRSIRVLLILAAWFSICAACIQALLPSLAADVLGLGATGFGVLFGMFGAGALVGAGTREQVRFRLGGRMLPVTIMTFGVAGTVVGLVPIPIVTGLALAVTGVTWVWALTTLNASVQTLAPRWVRGRVVSLYLLTLGLQPVGALIAGLAGEVIGVGSAIAGLTGILVIVGGVASRVRIPVLGDLKEPAPAPEDFPRGSHADVVSGSPIVVETVFEIDLDRIDAFFSVMRELRRQRMRTGATRWSLFHDAERPHVITEMFAVPDWEEHMAQHRRIDAEAAEVIRRARSFDVRGEPTARHLAGLDVVGQAAPSIAQQLVMVHAKMHETDGSVPLSPPQKAGTQ